MPRLRANKLRHGMILNAFIKARQYTSYLEIGVWRVEANFNRINCQRKVGVDPAPKTTSPKIMACTSDEYFRTHDEAFDLIFIDGFHEAEQALKDINNSLAHLKANGVIVIHDSLPPTAWHQRPSSENFGGSWNGTVWKAVLTSFMKNDSLCYIINADWGCAVIDTAKAKRHSTFRLNPSLTYEHDFGCLREFVISATAFVAGDFLDR